MDGCDFTGVFIIFKRDDGKIFKETLTSDGNIKFVRSYPFEEALAFSKAHLKSLAENQAPSWQDKY